MKSPDRHRIAKIAMCVVLTALVLLRCAPSTASPPLASPTPISGLPTAAPRATSTLLNDLATATAYAKLPGGQLVPQIPLVPADQIEEQYPGLSGHLLYTNFEGIWDKAIGGEPKKIYSVEQLGYLSGAAWSPDGSQVAFSYTPPTPDGNFAFGGGDIYMMNANGSDVRLVIVDDDPASTLSEPAWSPDGQWLYFTYYSYVQSAAAFTSTLRIERAAPDGTEREPVVDGAFQPDLSADGEALAFVRSDPDTFAQSLWVAQSDGSEARMILSADEFYALSGPRFAPDNRTIIFAGSGASATLPNSSRSSSDTAPAGWFDWFNPPPAAAHGLPWDLYTIHVDGTGLKTLTNLGEDQPSVVFTDDGRYALFWGARGMYVMNTDGSRLQRLSDTGGHGSLDWRP